MKKEKLTFLEEQISIDEILIKFWKKKFYVMVICVLCLLLACLFSYFETKRFKTTIVLKEPPIFLFKKYNFLFNVNEFTKSSLENSLSLEKNFFFIFQRNILSSDNLMQFIKEHKDIYIFKETSRKNYFNEVDFEINKIFPDIKNNLVENNKFFFIYTDQINGPDILNHYVKFIYKKSINIFKTELKQGILSEISNYQSALLIAQNMNLEEPKINSSSPQLFYLGSKILNQKIIYLKKALSDLENEDFNYDFIVDMSSKGKILSVPTFTYAAAGLIIGLFLSIFIFLFKAILKNT